MSEHIAIVGSGVAGSLLACRLARAGQRVTVLEAGPQVDRAQTVAGFRRRPAFSGAYPELPWAGRPEPENLRGYYLQAGPDLFTGLYERRVGGTTWHWLGTCLRFLPDDFRLRSRYGVGWDWPLAYADLEPYYTGAERELGVAGDNLQNLGSWRSGPYPLPALERSYLDRVLSGRGYPVHVLPAARNSRPFQGRPACCGSGSCVPVCPTGAKYDATVHLQRALDHGATLLAPAVVHRLRTDASGRVTGLDWLSPEGQESHLQAEAVVVAAHAIESPRLLLMSGLGQGTPVGRYLMGGSTQVSWSLAGECVYPYRGPQVTSGMLAFRNGSFRRRRAAFWTSLGNDGWPLDTPPQVAERLIRQGLKGSALRAALRDEISRQVLLSSTCEELAHADNRVELASDQPDGLGLPRPRIHYRVGEYTQEALNEATLVHERWFEALDATRRNHVERSVASSVIAGTCRMGTDPQTSVVDTDLRCHHHPNLYVLGSAVFPSSPAAPPTLTVAALALRLADYLQGRPG